MAARSLFLLGALANLLAQALPVPVSACAAACAAHPATRTTSTSSNSIGAVFMPLASTPATWGLAVCAGGVAVGCSGDPIAAVYLPANASFPSLLTAPYAAVAPDGTSATGVIILHDAHGTLLEVNDTILPVDPTATAAFGGTGYNVSDVLLVTLMRSVRVWTADGVGDAAAGFASRLSLHLLPCGAPSDYRWFLPGIYYNDGGASSNNAFVPGGAFGGGGAYNNRSLVPSLVVREDRLGAPLAALLDARPLISDGFASGSGAPVAMIFRPTLPGVLPDTVLADTLLGTPLVDPRLAFASLGFEGLVTAGGGPARGAKSATARDSGEAAAGDCTGLTFVYPGSEYPHTYQSQSPDGNLWRAHPLSHGFAHNFSVTMAWTNVSTSAGPEDGSGLCSEHGDGDASEITPALNTAKEPAVDPSVLSTSFRSALAWSWRGAVGYYNPLPVATVNISQAYEAVLEALAATFTPASPIPGVPTGFDKMTGVPYSPVLELGFVGPQLRMAAALLYDGLTAGGGVGNATRRDIAVAMLDAWVAATGPGYGHTVWDMGHTSSASAASITSDQKNGDGDSVSAGKLVSRRSALKRAPSETVVDAGNGGDGGSGDWIDDGPIGAVFLRRAVVSHHHAIEAADLVTRFAPGNATLMAKAATWRAWAMSLAAPLVAAQATNGSWSRQYAVPNVTGAAPVPIETSTTATVLPIRFLVAAANATGNVSWVASALAAGEYAWNQFGSRSLYVGAAIDNPDVLDKESALFAADSYLALAEAAAMAVADGLGINASVWFARASSAALVASTWVQTVPLPNPLDSPVMDFSPSDTAVGYGLIAVGHSGSDSFSSMFLRTPLALCAAAASAASAASRSAAGATDRSEGSGSGDAIHARFAALAAANTQQSLDLTGSKGYAQRGFSSELFSFSVGWDIFSGHNDGRGIGDPHFVPWTAANAAYGVASLCWNGGSVPGWPEACRAEFSDVLVGLPC